VKSENGALYIGNFDENGVKTGLGSYYDKHYRQSTVRLSQQPVLWDVDRNPHGFAMILVGWIWIPIGNAKMADQKKKVRKCIVLKCRVFFFLGVGGGGGFFCSFDIGQLHPSFSSVVEPGPTTRPANRLHHRPTPPPASPYAVTLFTHF
jgi:hypothetical protein